MLRNNVNKIQRYKPKPRMPKRRRHEFVPWIVDGLSTDGRKLLAGDAFDASVFAKALGTKYLSGVEQLQLGCNDIDPYGMEEICDGLVKATHLNLKTLYLHDNKIEDYGLTTLGNCIMRSPHLGSLERLCIDDNNINYESNIVGFFNALAKSPHLNRLRVLMIENISMGERGIIALADCIARSPHLSSLGKVVLFT